MGLMAVVKQKREAAKDERLNSANLPATLKDLNILDSEVISDTEKPMKEGE